MQSLSQLPELLIGHSTLTPSSTLRPLFEWWFPLPSPYHRKRAFLLCFWFFGLLGKSWYEWFWCWGIGICFFSRTCFGLSLRFGYFECPSSPCFEQIPFLQFFFFFCSKSLACVFRLALLSHWSSAKLSKKKPTNPAVSPAFCLMQIGSRPVWNRNTSYRSWLRGTHYLYSFLPFPPRIPSFNGSFPACESPSSFNEIDRSSRLISTRFPSSLLPWGSIALSFL